MQDDLWAHSEGQIHLHFWHCRCQRTGGWALAAYMQCVAIPLNHPLVTVTVIIVYANCASKVGLLLGVAGSCP